MYFIEKTEEKDFLMKHLGKSFIHIGKQLVSKNFLTRNHSFWFSKTFHCEEKKVKKLCPEKILVQIQPLGIQIRHAG